jgi:hypothetical protein
MRWGLQRLLLSGREQFLRYGKFPFRETQAGSIKSVAVPQTHLAFSAPTMFSKSFSASLETAMLSKGWEMTWWSARQR